MKYQHDIISKMSLDKFGRSVATPQHGVNFPRIRLPFTITQYGNINFGNVTLFNIKDPAGRSDAANKGYVDKNIQMLQQKTDEVHRLEDTHHDEMKKLVDSLSKDLHRELKEFSNVRLGLQQTNGEIDRLKSHVHHNYDEIMDLRRTQQDLKVFKQETQTFTAIEKKAVQKKLDDLNAKLDFLTKDVVTYYEMRKEFYALKEKLDILFNQENPSYEFVLRSNIKNREPIDLIKREVNSKDAVLQGETAASQ